MMYFHKVLFLLLISLCNVYAANSSSNILEYTQPNTDHPDFIIRDNFYMVKSDWSTMKGFTSENMQDVLQSYQNVCKVIAKKPANAGLQSKLLQIGTMQDLQNICEEMQNLEHKNNNAIMKYFAENFIPYLLGDDNLNTNKGTFTGYYYPTLNASRTKEGKYKYPIYKKPPELQSGQPFLTRLEIEKGSLNGRGLEIFWTDDFVDLYFLHIQGSGMLKLTDGTYTHVKFSAKNGQPYDSIGKYMLAKGYIQKGSDTKNFLIKNEHLAQEIMGVNKSYIFFEEDKSGVVRGAHGSELVDNRSLAVDNQFIPYGAMLFINTKNYNKFMFAQDTGSAIKGVIRGDIFTGEGYEAGEIAKTIHQPGFAYILVHKSQGFKWI